jgi:hypothetical protein
MDTDRELELLVSYHYLGFRSKFLSGESRRRKAFALLQENTETRRQAIFPPTYDTCVYWPEFVPPLDRPARVMATTPLESGTFGY